MLRPLPSRAWLALAVSFLLLGTMAAQQQHSTHPVTQNNPQLPPPTGSSQPPAPVVRRAPAPGNPTAQVSANPHPAGSPATSPNGALAPGQRPGADLYGKGEHLTAWMNAHSNLTPMQQQAALEREPGFRDLPAPTQQRIRDRLTELSTMTPERRARILARNEQMERLNPEQRAQVRGAMDQLGALPPDQRKVVYGAFHNLRGLPPEQRLPMLNSDRYRLLNPAQRATLQRLMQVEPILPRDDVPPPPPMGPMQHP